LDSICVMNDSVLTQQTANVLEWPRLLDVVAGQARSPMGAERCRALPLEATLEGARVRMQETAEMVLLRNSTDSFPGLSFPDVREALGRAGKGAILETHELRDLSLVLGLAAEATRYLDRRKEEAPALWTAATSLDALRPAQPAARLKSAIDRCIDPEGNIRESATPDLRRLMHHAQALKQSMRRRLETILASRRYAEVLQEQYFAQREGRYVVPVKAEMRGRIPGIVHDVSGSGATVFLEPRELVDLNNAIKVADLEVEREVRRILQDLSLEAAGHAPALLAGLEGLALLDAIAAKAGFSALVAGHPVTLNDRGRIMLRNARHPLLVLAREQVVANDILMEEEVRVLVISGPNTGGKTVTLKIMGLFALMVRAGLEPSCGADSEMAVFPDVYADIGDAQDLTKDLSSFSAHITQMIRLLREAGERRDTQHLTPDAAPPTPNPQYPTPGPARGLVLLDEPVTSTDPNEGAALAEALLVRLAQLRLKVVATTHYTSLKALAQTTPGFMNASVEFDISRLAPTYRVLMGIPGGSAAIDIAGRLGMDETLLEHALGLLQREDHKLEQMLSELQERQRRLHEDQARTAELKEAAEKAARDSAEVAERLQLSEREQRKSVQKKLTDELLRARAQVQEVLDELKGERSLVKAKEAKQRLAAIEETARAHLVPEDEKVPLEYLSAGDRVEIVSLGATGTLLEAPLDKKRVRVRVGETEMSVAASLLVGRTGVAEEQKPSQGWAPPLKRAAMSGLGGDAPAALDLRGKTAEEALEQTVAALDRAALAGAPSLRIIHGHGTGRLKAVLRDYLKASPYVAGFRVGERAEGGDGVTIAELR
jgi:DNA mismatch repair protein MutS2